jgi:hypothetical protein
MNLKKVYDYLKESGELLEMFPNFSGEWEKDKSKFKKEHLDIVSSIIKPEDEDEDDERLFYVEH